MVCWWVLVVSPDGWKYRSIGSRLHETFYHPTTKTEHSPLRTLRNPSWGEMFSLFSMASVYVAHHSVCKEILKLNAMNLRGRLACLSWTAICRHGRSHTKPLSGPSKNSKDTPISLMVQLSSRDAARSLLWGRNKRFHIPGFSFSYGKQMLSNGRQDWL